MRDLLLRIGRDFLWYLAILTVMSSLYVAAYLVVYQRLPEWK